MSDGIKCRQDVLDLGTEELRRSSERIPILPQNTLIVVDVGLVLLMISACGEVTSIQKVVDRPGDLDLTRVGSAFVVNERVEGGLGSEESLNAHSSEDLSEQRDMNGIVENQRRNRCGEGCSVQNPEMLLGLEGDWLDIVLSKRPV